jgi:hypothetical protein
MQMHSDLADRVDRGIDCQPFNFFKRQAFDRLDQPGKILWRCGLRFCMYGRGRGGKCAGHSGHMGGGSPRLQ